MIFSDAKMCAEASLWPSLLLVLTIPTLSVFFPQEFFLQTFSKLVSVNEIYLAVITLQVTGLKKKQQPYFLLVPFKSRLFNSRTGAGV